MITDKFLAEIDRGRQGHNQGISTGLTKLDGITDGVSRETYTVVLSGTGGGKSSYVLYSYVYKPIMAHLDDDNFKCLYISLELSETALFIKLLSMYIYETYGKELSYKEILSRKQEYILSDEDYELVRSCMPWVEKVYKHLEIYDKSASSKTIYAILKSRLESIGKFSMTETREIYTPYNPELIYVVIVDHISLLTPTDGRNLKGEIDLLSKYLLTLRDKCGISPVVVQQANREQGNIERFKQGKSAYTLLDGKDSGNPSQDCNIFIALYNPFKDGLKTYHKYNIDILQDTFRSILVLKNRWGECDVEVGVNFFGKASIFRELPRPDEIYDYSKFTKLPSQEIEDNTPSNFNFTI